MEGELAPFEFVLGLSILYQCYRTGRLYLAGHAFVASHHEGRLSRNIVYLVNIKAIPHVELRCVF